MPNALAIRVPPYHRAVLRRAPAVLLLFLCAFPAAATRIRRLSLEEIRDSASAVVLVDVLGSSTRTGEAGMIWTDYRARVVEALRGRDEAFVSLDGERLTVGREGVLARARAAAPPASQSLAAPIARNADGTPAVLGLAAPRTSAAASPRSASRAEIRRFVRGSFGGRPAAAQTP